MTAHQGGRSRQLSPYFVDDSLTLYCGDALDVARELADGSVDCIITSPPYFGLRDYGTEGQYGLEATPAEYIETMRVLFTELRRVLSDDGTLWLNLGDSYAASGGHTDAGETSSLQGRRILTHQNSSPGRKGADRPAKNLLGIPWRVAFALQDAWILRKAITWYKPNAMPESVRDRFSTRCELLFLFAKSPRYWFDLDAVREPLPRPETLDKGIVFGGKNAGVGKVGSSPRRGGGYRSVYGQPAAARPPGTNPQTNAGPTGSRHSDKHAKGRNPGDFWEVDTVDEDAPPAYLAWSIPTQPFPEAHFAVMPLKLAERCVRAGCKPGGTVLDCFSGSGTTGLAAARHGRKYIGIDLNQDYLALSLRTRLTARTLDFGEVS
jgi:DNA modification methylase